MVGGSYTTGGDEHAFLYTGGALADIGTLGGNESVARGINNFSQVVGYSQTADDKSVHAFIDNNGNLADIGTLGGNSSSAYAINDLGQIVGHSSTSAGSEHAFLYRDGDLIDLNSLSPADSGWTLQNAYAINQDGQIVGTGIIDGETHAFLATDPPATAVPEPDSVLGTLVLGVFSMGAWLKRRKGVSCDRVSLS